MEIDVEQKIEKWKSQLLNLSKGNCLLNYNETTHSSLQILLPDCISLWKSFVKNEKPLEFPYSDEELSSKPAAHGVKTNQNVKEMQKTLSCLREKAKTANEEHGVNMLYLSFGFLKWTEPDDSGAVFNSPLILVPATLTVKSVSSPYILSILEDEIVINPTLCYKLEHDFGINLPAFDEDADVQLYLENVTGLVAKNSWKVDFGVGLSLLPFHEITVYNDWIRHEEAIRQSPVIKAICGDTTACDKIPEEITGFDFDSQQKPGETFQVVDADSSQQETLLCAKKGISFVLQGPPGTGKSQTITNIISECLAEGKKVLFVSEKTAALETVHARLANARLDDFCLFLHSRKANKRTVLGQLNAMLKMASQKAQLKEESYQKLEALQTDRDKLNAYVHQLHIKISPLGKSIFEANGILAHLASYPDVVFAVENMGEITRKQYNRKLYLLGQFSNTMGKMSEDYSDNPWKGAIIPTVTNEMRHTIDETVSSLVPKVIQADQRTREICDSLSLQWEKSYAALKKLLPVLDVAKQSPGIPLSWIAGNEITPLFDEASKYERWKVQFLQKQNELETQYQTILLNDKSITDLEVKSLTDSGSIQNAIINIESFISGKPYSNWDLANARLFSLFNEAKEKSAKMNELRAKILSTFESEIFGIDFNGIYDRYITDYTSFWKLFKKSYISDKKMIQVHYKTFVNEVTDEMVLSTVVKLREIWEFNKWFSDNQSELVTFFGNLYKAEKTDFNLIESGFTAFKALNKSYSLLIDMQEIAEIVEQKENELAKHFQVLYKGMNTDWNNVRKSLTWAANFRRQAQTNHLNYSFIEEVCSKPETAKNCETFSKEIRKIIGNMDSEIQWFSSLFDTKEPIQSLEMPALQDKLERCKNNLYLLDEWIEFRDVKENCREAGLDDYISKINELSVDKNKIIPIFIKRFFQLWLEAVLPQFPAVLNFKRPIHESTIDEFSELDKLRMDIAKEIIKSRLINNLPHIDRLANGVDEIGILVREINKQRHTMPVRKLFREIPHLLLTLKPCILMSPLAVGRFLDADGYRFDTVIFDEASQIATEHAIGAILRGKQVIIAGDSKQLSPSNLFTASLSDEEVEADDNTNAFKSILNEAHALPERNLLWHYRSRHEHLFAFSNARFYNNRLITFPSNTGKAKAYGVEYIFVKEGFYDYDGKQGNVPEAKKVAELVFEHFREQPNRSLGVIALDKAQKQAIDAEIHSMRIKNRKCEPFFNEEIQEPFFIKTLDNVQGDERDSIILSIGYAKDTTGALRMNFESLSKSDGERRLNVAITRAQWNVKLVGSIMPGDIDRDKISSGGTKLLLDYIGFAVNGADALVQITAENDFTQNDSPFEEVIYNFLDRNGYKVVTQVGCSGYRIDMAIKHPALNEIYVLGIECDGATYHSARTACERDRLRREALKNNGWNMYRIWSTDWVKDPITEGNRLIAAINEAISTFDTSEISIVNETDTQSMEVSTVDNPTLNPEPQSDSYPFKKQEEPYFEPLPVEVPDDVEVTNDEPLPVAAEPVAVDNSIAEDVKVEYPLHVDILCEEIAQLLSDLKGIDEKVSIKIHHFAEKQYPKDMNMQNYIISKQMESFSYMQTVTDKDLLLLAESKYEDDYTMQHYFYDNQIKSKKYMRTATDREIKDLVITKYPNDFKMQQYVYDSQAQAKKFITSVTDMDVKNRVVSKYPNNYRMQVYAYEKIKKGK